MAPLESDAGDRVCSHDSDMTTCWWVLAGNPHAGRGHACVCFHDPDDWVPLSAAVRRYDAAHSGQSQGGPDA